MILSLLTVFAPTQHSNEPHAIKNNSRSHGRATLHYLARMPLLTAHAILPEVVGCSCGRQTPTRPGSHTRAAVNSAICSTLQRRRTCAKQVSGSWTPEAPSKKQNSAHYIRLGLLATWVADQDVCRIPRPQTLSSVLIQPPDVVHRRGPQRDGAAPVLVDVPENARVAERVAGHLHHRRVRPQLHATRA